MTNPLQLSDEQLRLLNDWSARTGKSPQELLAEALDEYQLPMTGPTNRQQGETLLDRLSRAGLSGCLAGGPPDLSTNPEHMEGFGE